MISHHSNIEEGAVVNFYATKPSYIYMFTKWCA